MRLWQFSNVQNIFAIRRANLRKLFDQWGGPTALSMKLGHSNGSYVAQVAGPHPIRDISEKGARKIESKLGLEQGWLDQVHRESGELDTALVLEVIATLKDLISAEKLKISQAKFSELVSFAYTHTLKSGRIDRACLKALVKLLKP